MPYGNPYAKRRGRKPLVKGQKVYDINRCDQPPLNPNGVIQKINWGRGGPKSVTVKFHDDRLNPLTYVEYERDELGRYTNETFGWQVPEKEMTDNERERIEGRHRQLASEREERGRRASELRDAVFLETEPPGIGGGD